MPVFYQESMSLKLQLRDHGLNERAMTYYVDLLETGSLGKEERLLGVNKDVVEIGTPVTAG